MKNRGLLRKGSSVASAFLLSLLLWAILIMAGCFSGILRDSTLLQAVDDSAYHEKSYEQFTVQAEALLDAAGISKEAFRKALPLRKFYIDEKQSMQDALHNKESIILEEETKEEIENSISAYYEEKAITITSELDAAITETSGILAKEYTEWIKLSFLNSISDYWKGIKSKMILAFFVCIILAGILVFMICSMYQHKHKALRYVVSGIIGAILLNEASIFLLRKWIDYREVVSGPVYYQDFIEAYFNEGIASIQYQTITGFVLLLITVMILCIMRKRVTGE